MPSTKKKAAPKPKSKKDSITLRIDPQLEKMWKKALASLQNADREGMRAFDQKYEIVGEIIDHDPPLYLAAGMSTARDFIAKYLGGENERSVRRNVRVARYASPDEEAKFGAHNIDAAIDYLEAKHGRPAKGRIPVHFEKLRIAGKDGSVLFPHATVQQIRDATRALSRGDGAKKTNGARGPVVSTIEKEIPKAAKEVTVHYADGRVSLGRIPVRLFAAVMRALAKARVPTD